MPPAARVGDPSGHPGVLTGPGESTVLIIGIRACRVGDIHTCFSPHLPTPIVTGSKMVLIGGRRAARVGDVAACGVPIVAGADTVVIGG